MNTLHRDRDRCHMAQGEHGIWHTFRALDHPGPLASGFGVLTMLSELWLPPGGCNAPPVSIDAEIITYVYKGSLAQEVSTGSSRVIHTGEFQRMASVPGIRRKETNVSTTEWAHIFRISLSSLKVGLDDAHEQKRFTAAQRRNSICVIASPDGRRESLHIHQDALIFSSMLRSGQHLVHELLPGRSTWLHTICGEVVINDIILTQGDGLGIELEPSVSLTIQQDAEILLIDVGPARGSNLIGACS